MKKIIRQGVFESNSSSTHSLIMCTEEIYEKWKKGEILLDRWNKKFVEPREYTEEELRREYFKYKIKTISNGILYKDTYYKDIEDLINSDVQVSAEELNKVAKDMNNNFSTFDSYWGYDSWSDLETFKESYVTPNGEKIIAFGKYGYDG